MADLCFIIQTKHSYMKANMGTADKTIRILLAALVLILYFTNVISGLTAIILLVFAGIFILTSFISFCPLYYPFGISTRKKAGN